MFIENLLFNPVEVQSLSLIRNLCKAINLNGVNVHLKIIPGSSLLIMFWVILRYRVRSYQKLGEILNLVTRKRKNNLRWRSIIISQLTLLLTSTLYNLRKSILLSKTSNLSHRYRRNIIKIKIGILIFPHLFWKMG